MKITKKTWGEEQTIVNDNLISKKLIIIKGNTIVQNPKTESEMLFITKGNATIEINPTNKTTLKTGEYLHIKDNEYKIITNEDSEILISSINTKIKEEDNKNSHIQQIVNNFKKKRVMIIGEIMLDKHINGEVYNSDYPYPVIKVKNEKHEAGGSIDIAKHVNNLGGKSLVISVVGNDEPGMLLKKILWEERIFHFLAIIKNNTIRRTKIVSNSHNLVRFDYEDNKIIDKGTEERLLNKIRENVSRTDIIVIRDFGKGLMTRSFIENLKIIASKKSIPIVADFRIQNIDYSRDILINIMSKNDAFARAGNKYNEIKELNPDIIKELRSNIILTDNNKIYLLKKDYTISEINNEKRTFDISNSKELLISAIALSIASGANLDEACEIGKRIIGTKETIGAINLNSL